MKLKEGMKMRRIGIPAETGLDVVLSEPKIICGTQYFALVFDDLSCSIHAAEYIETNYEVVE